MNNEPVAWMTKDDFENNRWTVAKVRYEKKYDYSIPLYTHPAKTLTDEELVAHVPLMAWEVFSSSLFRLEDNEITNDEFIKRCYEVVKARCNHPQPDYTQFNTQVHPFKTLTDENYEVVFDGEKYTTKLKEQTKTITDEEILNICWQKGITWWKLSDGDMDEQTMIEFARAILRKAQEK